ncbi:hypothetical protein CPB86DRAFT_744893 [Serendipita vermifera]|nr:hypothetical protein CPB86DRAFT_744893 [Serendipita vermifera]
MPRPQNRQSDELRPVQVKIERLDRVDASAKFAFGSTVALTSISGPIEARMGIEIPSKAALDIILRPLHGVPGVTEKALNSVLKSIFSPSILLNAHPRTVIQMVFQSLSLPTPRPSTSSRVSKFDYHPSMAAALINSGSLALLDTGTIPLTGVIIAMSVGVVVDKGTRSVIVDPEEDETLYLVGGGVFAFLFAGTHAKIPPLGPLGKVVWSSWEGEFRVEEVEKAESLALDAASKVLDRFRQTLAGNPSGNAMLID